MPSASGILLEIDVLALEGTARVASLDQAEHTRHRVLDGIATESCAHLTPSDVDHNLGTA
jgi:hypothetical protein